MSQGSLKLSMKKSCFSDAITNARKVKGQDGIPCLNTTHNTEKNPKEVQNRSKEGKKTTRNRK